MNGWATIDSVILALTFMALIGVGIYYNRKNTSSEDFLVAGRNVGYNKLTATVLATDLGGGFTIGLAGMAFATGLSATWLTLTGFIGCILVAKFLIPKVKSFGDKLKQFTLPDYLEYRYNKNARLMGSIITIFASVTFVGTQIVAGALLIQAATGMDMKTAAWIAGIVVIVYTSLGGLNAVITTDLIQWSIIILGIFLLAFPMSMNAVDGWAGLTKNLPAEYFSFGEYSLLTVGAWMLAIVPAWFISMTTWQRIYAAKDERTAKKAYYTTAFLEWPLFAFVGALMGMMAKALFPDIPAEQGLPTLLTQVLPIGITGIVVAAYAAAVMSTADSLLIVATATTVRDIYQRFINPNATDKQIMKMSMIVTIVFGLGSLTIALYLPFVLKLLLYGYAFQAALFFPVIFGLYWRKANATAAFWSLLIGGVGSLAWAISGNPFDLDPIYFGMPVTLLMMLIISNITGHSSTENLDLDFKDSSTSFTMEGQAKEV
jgi:SSS family solute:Na+ symporter